MAELDREERTVMFRQRGAGFVGRSPVSEGRSGWNRRGLVYPGRCFMSGACGGRWPVPDERASRETGRVPGSGRNSQVNRRTSVQPGCAQRKGRRVNEPANERTHNAPLCDDFPAVVRKESQPRYEGWLSLWAAIRRHSPACLATTSGWGLGVG